MVRGSLFAPAFAAASAVGAAAELESSTDDDELPESSLEPEEPQVLVTGSSHQRWELMPASSF
ncbi:hypothetical protein P4S72_29970 [Vibrio sp. PP-XX7]